MMIIEPSRYEIITEKRAGSKGTVEKAMSIGFEQAMKDKGRECDYEFRVGKKDGHRVVLCEVKLDNGYMIHYREDESPDLKTIEKDSYQFLNERL